ncbi:BPG_G0025980.mRNA.1.CDS.1 [Saccharomyces cerevisiae]|nr:BPG_G0025980.mRNA.1.CDS.1 [Saccharomyces cerevisiae]CAI7089667.1 BPG_G0025980.mRNA.1.CDS.1 [Saccharomyces cerevisiae]
MAPHVYSYAQNVRMPIVGVPGCLEKPFCAPAKFPLSVKKEYPNFRFGPSYRSLLSKPKFSLL